MQLVVCDTTILLPGLVNEDGLYRKILIVFAWGKLHHELRALQDERAAAERMGCGHSRRRARRRLERSRY